MAIAELVMPKLGESIMEATILKWHKKVGDYVKFDETVLDIATDKVDSEVPSTEQGIITEILFQVNDVVPIGAVIARIQTNAETKTTDTPTLVETPITPVIEPIIAEAPVFIEPIPEPIQQIQIPEPAVEHIPYTPTPFLSEIHKPIGNRFYSPLVLNIANSEGISLSELERIPGTGNDGRVSKRDVLQYVADRKSGRVPVYQQPVYQQPVYTPPVQTPITPPVSTTVPTPTQAPAVAPIPTQIAPTEHIETSSTEHLRFPKPTEYTPEVNYPDEVVNHPIHQEEPVIQPVKVPVEQKVLINTSNPITHQAHHIASNSGKFSDQA